MEGWAGVVLAGGSGSRMKSCIPKVLHKVCGKEMIRYPVEALREARVGRICVVVSPQVEQEARSLLGDTVEYVLQSQPLGTGDALLCARSALEGKAAHLLVINGDLSLATGTVLKEFMDVHLEKDLTMALLTARGSLHEDMGRVVRDGKGKITAVVELGQQSSATEPVTEVNGGAYCFKDAWLWDNLRQVPPSPSGERYLTALVALASSQRAGVDALVRPEPQELLGVNNRLQLACVEAIARQRIREGWMREGVTLIDPPSTFIDATVSLGQDTVIYPNTMLLGICRIGANCVLGPGAMIQDTSIGEGCHVSMSVLEGATLEEDVRVGPFSHIRPGSHLERGVYVGNYAEVKASRLGRGVKMGHFSYAGDADVGPNANLGAGMVTVNFDGVSKHRTIIEEDALIGSDTMLVAPVRIGARSATGAGAVVTKDIPADRLAVGIPARIVRKQKTPRTTKGSDG